MARLSRALRTRGGFVPLRQQQARRTTAGFKPAAAFKPAPPFGTTPLDAMTGLLAGRQGQLSSTMPGAPAPPAPAAPSAQAPPPVDPQYDAEVADATAQKKRRLASLQYRAGQLGSEFGYGVAFNDATGQAAAGAEDLNNPFSRLAMLKRAYQTQQNVTSQGMGAAGQLYSGALENQNASDRFSDEAQRDALQREFAARLGGLTAEGGEITGAYDTAVNVTAPGNRLARALAARPEDPGAGYEAYKAQAGQNQAAPLPIQQWIDKGNPETTLTGQGAFGGRKLAAQFNTLPGADQRAWRDYFVARGGKGLKVMLPAQWIAAGRPKS